MALFDDIMGKVDEVAGHLGLPAEQVQAMTATLQGKLGSGSDQLAAIEETAREHGVPVETIQALVSHADLSGGIGGFLASEAKNLFG